MKKYKVQVWDSDCEVWEDADDFPPSSKLDAEDDARQIKRRCAHPVRTRVVAVDGEAVAL